MAKRKRPQRRIKVTIKKLGRHKAHGLCYSDGHIEVDPRGRARSRINTAVHESLHAVLPELSETRVARSACSITRVLWEMGCRLIAR